MLGLIHGTESDPGTFAGNYFWFTVAHPDYCPHALIDPLTNQSIRFISHDLPSKALRNLQGGVETNNRPGGVYQIEVVGRAADFGSYSGQRYDNLRAFLRETEALTGIKMQFVTHQNRFTFEEWMNPDLEGWFGHYNVPENDHWDPGTLNLQRLMPLQPQKVPDMDPSYPIPVQNHDVHGNPTGPAKGTAESVASWTHDEAARAAGAARDARDNALAAVTYSQAASAKLDRVLDLIEAQPVALLSEVPTSELLAELSRRLSVS